MIGVSSTRHIAIRSRSAERRCIIRTPTGAHSWVLSVNSWLRTVQQCIVHLVRAALKYVVDADRREVARDLRNIYLAATVLGAEDELQKFGKKWDSKYPTISKQWNAKWRHITSMFDLPPAIRKATYTTKTIESVNSVIRKFTRYRKQYPSRESALKLIFMAIREASRKWTMPIPKWKDALNHFAILFEGRMPKLS